jgi:hypothetical protein
MKFVTGSNESRAAEGGRQVQPGMSNDSTGAFHAYSELISQLAVSVARQAGPVTWMWKNVAHGHKMTILKSPVIAKKRY